MSTTIVNPIPALAEKMAWWEKWIVSQAFGSSWETRIWDIFVAEAKTLAASSPLTVASLTTYINDNLETLISKIRVGNALAEVFESAAAPFIINLIDSEISTVVADVVAYVNELTP